MTNEICPKLKKERKERRERRRRKAKHLGFKFHRKPIRQHGVRIVWKNDNIESRIGTCLVCGKKGKDCTCKIEVSDNQFHF